MARRDLFSSSIHLTDSVTRRVGPGHYRTRSRQEAWSISELPDSGSYFLSYDENCQVVQSDPHPISQFSLYYYRLLFASRGYNVNESINTILHEVRSLQEPSELCSWVAQLSSDLDENKSESIYDITELEVELQRLVDLAMREYGQVLS